MNALKCDVTLMPDVLTSAGVSFCVENVFTGPGLRPDSDRHAKYLSLRR